MECIYYNNKEDYSNYLYQNKNIFIGMKWKYFYRNEMEIFLSESKVIKYFLSEWNKNILIKIEGIKYF